MEAGAIIVESLFRFAGLAYGAHLKDNKNSRHLQLFICVVSAPVPGMIAVFR